MNKSFSFHLLPREALQALLGLIAERFPTSVKGLLGRLKRGADVRQELLVPVRLLVYGILGEQKYEDYTRCEKEALAGDVGAASDWVRMLSVCRLLVRPVPHPLELCPN